MESYEKLLEKAYKKVKLIEKSSDRFEIPKLSGQVSGKNTIITNIMEIATYIRRPADQVGKFLQKELAAPTRLEKDRLIISAKLNSSKVNEKIQLYTKEFVICSICGKPDTEIITEKGVKEEHCLACGAKSPIKYHI